MAIPVPNESQDTFGLVVGCGEIAVLEYSAVENGEPYFHLVHSRGMRWCVHEAKALAMALVEALPSFVLAIVVSVEVIPDHVDRFFGGTCGQGHS